MSAAQITAVIPTLGRPSVRRAVRSALQQSAPTEVVVVLDDPDQRDLVTRRLDGLDYQLVVTPGRVGGGAARNLGVAHAQTPLVAFLDDDDEWTSDKNALQQAAAEPELVQSSRAMLTGSSSRIVPEVIYPGRSADKSLADYVLDRSTLRLSRHFLQTSTLMCHREAALEVPWDESLRRHQDWDWVIRLETAGLRIHQHSEVLVRVFQASVGSISRRPDWQSSQAWFNALSIPVSRQSAGDFSAAVVARGAFESGAFLDGIRALARGMRYGAHVPALMVGLSGVMSRGGHRG